MTEAFWWYLLAGFILGFSISTFWEWLYFRRRRMAIRDRRIAELESTVRTYMVATSVPETRAATEDDWSGATFENPHVYLETEENPATPPPDSLPPDNGRPAPAYTYVSAAANGAASPVPPPYEGLQVARVAPVAYAAQPLGGASATSFQSVAVQQPPVPAVAEANQVDNSFAPAAFAAAAVAAAARHERDEGKPAEEPFEDELPETIDAAASGAAMLAPDGTAQDNVGDEHKEHRQESTVGEDLTRALAALGGIAAVNAAHENDAAEDLTPVGTSADAGDAVATALASDDERATASKPITSDDLDALRASINDLLGNVSAERATVEAGSARPLAGQAAVESDSEYYTTKINGRTEYVLVRLVQSVVQFARQVRAILTGDRAERPALHAAATTDELARIKGLTTAHVERLRVAGITTFGQLAAVSPDELRMLLLTPGDTAAIDYAQVHSEAARLARVTESELA